MKIIYFDGVCGLCNGFVDFMMRIDTQGVFHFSPLQSDYAKAHLPAADVQDLTSIVVSVDGKTFRKAEAVLVALSQLGAPWKLAKIFKVFPHSLSNSVYDFVATNRYRLFGKKETCRLPTPEERSRFLL